MYDNYADDANILINGQYYKGFLFKQLLSEFSEGFSYASSTIEEAYSIVDNLDKELKLCNSSIGKEYFDTLSSEKQKEIIDIVKYMVVTLCSRFCMFKENARNKEEAVELFDEKLSGIETELPYHIEFDENFEFDQMKTFQLLSKSLPLILKRNQAKIEADAMKNDNIEAFEMALSRGKINSNDIILINTLVTKSDVNAVKGFKKVRNMIPGCSFTPASPEQVPSKIFEILGQYYKDQDSLKDPYEFGIGSLEKEKRLLDIFRREAKLHIEFERTHPFEDGNGRTGRIILCTNLLKHHIVPPLLTRPMSKLYKNYIDNFDVEGLAQLLYASSSQQSVTWVSRLKSDKPRYGLK